MLQELFAIKDAWLALPVNSWPEEKEKAWMRDLEEVERRALWAEIIEGGDGRFRKRAVERVKGLMAQCGSLLTVCFQLMHSCHSIVIPALRKTFPPGRSKPHSDSIWYCLDFIVGKVGGRSKLNEFESASSFYRELVYSS